jgi:hypothetical protein
MTLAQTPALTDVTCAGCGYDLRAITSDRCPECGKWYDVTGALTPRLPRRGGGPLAGIRTHFLTAWRITRRPGVLADELDRMVDARRARRFRLTTVLVAWASVAGLLYWTRALWYVANQNSLRSAYAVNHFGGALDGLLIWERSHWISLVAIGVILVWATAAPRWFTYSPRLHPVRANRAAALARYTCAPLAFTPFAVLAAAQVQSLLAKYSDRMMFAQWEWLLFVGLAPALLVVAWLWCALVLVRRTIGCGVARTILTGLALAAVWAAMAALVFGAAHGITALAILLGRSWS